MYDVTLAPLVPWPVVTALGAVTVVLIAIALIRGGRGWLFRSLAMAALIAALLNPLVIREERDPQPDLAVVVVDELLSQTVGERSAQTEAALASLRATLAGVEDLETRVIRTGRDGDGRGTRLFSTLRQAFAETARERLAGAIVLTDGQIHDLPEDAEDIALAAPVHVLVSGAPDERDRRLVIDQAPAYGLVGRDVTIKYTVRETTSEGGETRPATAEVRVFVDGALAKTEAATVDDPRAYSLVLQHAGPTIVELEVAGEEGEASNFNNRAAVTINGVRDRLKVLLVSGQPHPGERTWRNLLKSDPSVDLIHFTILRPPEKDDMTPLRELSLIVFPVDELFEKKLDEFDLVIFDRYVVRGVLPFRYLQRIADYLTDGGAVLLAVGPEFASPQSLFRTPLGAVMPGAPTGRVVEQAFRPTVTDLGHRHPVTSGLPGERVSGDADDVSEASGPTWGHWFRLVEVEPGDGEILMDGPEGRPLLMVQRVGEGRIAQLNSDHIWLWGRGFEGGGPQAELLRRLAHWLMKEPELEEESLSATVENGRLLIERRSLRLDNAQATVTRPFGDVTTVVLEPGADGIARADVAVSETGIYRVSDGERTAVAASGAIAPVELDDLRATDEIAAALAEASGGGVSWLADGVPDVRPVKADRVAAGQGWMGLRRNEFLRGDRRLGGAAVAGTSIAGARHGRSRRRLVARRPLDH